MEEREVGDPVGERESVSLKVVAIFISPGKGEPMEELDAVRAIAGMGLEGDRYANRTGAFSGTKRIEDDDRQVSLISLEGINQANAELVARGKVPFDLAEPRRNLVVDVGADDLNALVGKRFRVGEVEMQGIE